MQKVKKHDTCTIYYTHLQTRSVSLTGLNCNFE